APPFGFPVGRCDAGKLTFTILRNSNTGSIIYVHHSIDTPPIDSLLEEPYHYTTPFLNQSQAYYFQSYDSPTGCKSQWLKLDAVISQIESFEKEVIFCNQGGRLTAQKGKVWNWSTGENNSTIFVRNSGLYEVQVSDEWGCKAIQKFHVRVLRLQPQDTIFTTIDNCIEKELWIDTTSLPRPLSVRWVSLAENSLSIKVKEPGNYMAIIEFPTIECKIQRVYKVSRPDSCNNAPYFWAPNAFSPNGDLQNDIWYMYSINVIQHKLTIFDRWGKIVFQNRALGNLSPETSYWDGSSSGGPLPEGIYIFTVEAEDRLGKWHQFRGTITLLR
ncbi:MAG: gliding motility-associated C-terminal domain-containing protein, partial [Bacteroidia bacterium]|nr:gliding motility-associated C-terminal domain-containing protein [Bacteroidia bacterium]MDW8158335.1 gliding motility-associated C-terminal domain-containing protein [Bacteroidia bacterium]